MQDRRTPNGRTCLAVVLAAGEGTRMKSSLPKVLHQVAGRPMVEHVMRAVSAVGADGVAVVIGPGREDVADIVRKVLPGADIFVQTERRGTAHAVLAAREAIAEAYDDLLVVFADTPLVQAATFGKMREELAGGASVVALGFEAADSTGYGRFLIEGGRLVAIREHKDASEQERRVRTCNAGLMAIDGRQALSILDAIGNSNAQAEFYLTDAVGVAGDRDLKSIPVIVSEEEVMGINDKVQLATAESILQKRLREDAMRAGVTMIAPETVFLCQDTKFGRDVVVEPFVVFGPGVTVADGAVIHSFSHLEGAKVGDAATVGPFARLRPGADLGEKAKVGNFVEVKATTIGADAKVSHLTYLGDASVGAGANIGAGTITCNYDGFDKYRTTIGAGAFIGSNSSLVAPVTIGDGAFVGSGSVITDNVDTDALAVARGRQYEKQGWAREFRETRKNRPKKR